MGGHGRLPVEKPASLRCIHQQSSRELVESVAHSQCAGAQSQQLLRDMHESRPLPHSLCKCSDEIGQCDVLGIRGKERPTRRRWVVNAANQQVRQVPYADQRSPAGHTGQRQREREAASFSKRRKLAFAFGRKPASVAQRPPRGLTAARVPTVPAPPPVWRRHRVPGETADRRGETDGPTPSRSRGSNSRTRSVALRLARRRSRRPAWYPDSPPGTLRAVGLAVLEHMRAAREMNGSRAPSKGTRESSPASMHCRLSRSTATTS